MRFRRCHLAFCALALVFLALPRMVQSQSLTTAASYRSHLWGESFHGDHPCRFGCCRALCWRDPHATRSLTPCSALTRPTALPRCAGFRALIGSSDPNSKFKGPADCLSLGRPYTPVEFLNHFMEVLGGNGIRYVGAMNVSPQVRERAQHLADTLNQNNRAPGFHASSEVAAIRVETVNGTFVIEQRLTAWVECRQRSGGGALQGGGCSATVDVLRAPKGKLDALAQLVDSHDLTKLVHDDQWLQRVMQTQQQRAQEQFAALREQAARGSAMLRQQYEQFNATMQRNHEAFMAQQQSQFESSMRNANASMNARSTIASDWVDYPLDQQTVTGSGGTVKISNAYTQTWSNGQGQWFQTNDPNSQSKRRSIRELDTADESPRRRDSVLMSAAAGSGAQVSARTGLDRCLALVVRYWSFNMTLVHNRGTDWPGFGYSKQEKAELEDLAGAVRASEFYIWLFLFVVITLAIFAAIAAAGFNCLLNAIGGEQNMARTPESMFFLMLALVALASLSIGFPAAMLPASALAGRFYGVRDSDLPDRQTTAHYFRKLWFQITRIGDYRGGCAVCRLDVRSERFQVFRDSKARASAVIARSGRAYSRLLFLPPQPACGS